MAIKRYHIAVSGRVQGVGYRYFTCDVAQAVSLSGWVRNSVGRQVEIEVEGEQDVIEGFIELLKQGPPLSRVTDVEVRSMVAAGEHGEFVIRG